MHSSSKQFACFYKADARHEISPEAKAEGLMNGMARQCGNITLSLKCKVDGKESVTSAYTFLRDCEIGFMQ